MASEEVPPPSARRLACGPYFYSLDASLGRGTFAEVFKGWDAEGHVVAIKRIPKARLKKSENSKRLLKSEVKILRELNHRNIVQLLDYQETSDYICLVLEYCDGGDLATFAETKSPMSEELIAFILLQLVRALKCLHDRDVVHRDLKPQNVLLCGTEYPVVKLADFGFARHLFSEDLAATFCGSPLYMAPEVLQGGAYNAKADLWSVGTIVYQMLTGRAPFRAENIDGLKALLKSSGAKVSFPPGTSKELADLLTGLLQPQAKFRLSFDDLFSHPFLGRAADIPSELGPHPAAFPSFVQTPPASPKRQPFYGDEPRSPSPSASFFNSADSVFQSTGSSRDGTQSVDDRSYVLIDKQFVELNALADAAEGRAKSLGSRWQRGFRGLTRQAAPNDEEVGDFVGRVEAISKPAAAVMAVAESHMRGLSDSTGPAGMSQSMMRGQSRAEALILYGKALHMLRTGMNQLRQLLAVWAGVSFASKANEAIQFLRKKFNECISKLETLRSLVPMTDLDANLPSAEEMMYEYAIALCKESAANEALHNLEASEVLYRRALVLLDILMTEADATDKAVLGQYIQGIKHRLEVVGAQSQAQAQAQAQAHNRQKQNLGFARTEPVAVPGAERQQTIARQSSTSLPTRMSPPSDIRTPAQSQSLTPPHCQMHVQPSASKASTPSTTPGTSPPDVQWGDKSSQASPAVHCGHCGGRFSSSTQRFCVQCGSVRSGMSISRSQSFGSVNEGSASPLLSGGSNTASVTDTTPPKTSPENQRRDLLGFPEESLESPASEELPFAG